MTAQNKEIAKVFRKAKTILAKNKAECFARGFDNKLIYQEYICHSILESCGPSVPRVAALNVVQSRLGGYYSLETWVLRNIPNVGYPVNKDDMQAYRHRWLDALIEEFSQ